MDHTFNYRRMFGNDSGENEKPEYLNSYFVAQPAFKPFFSVDEELSIVRARKGMGKSSLLTELYFDLQKKRPNDIVINTTGNELLGISHFESNDQAHLENHWRQIICKRICIEIGRKINWAASDDTMGLVEIAEIEGYKDQNLVSALASRVGQIVQNVLGKAATEAGDSNSTDVYRKRGIENYTEALARYQNNNDILVWVLIDDIDAKYRDTEENQERVGAFFSALRALSYKVNNLRLRASIRSDVWANLRKMEDQDKIRQYVFDIRWSDEALREIICKKILTYLEKCHSNLVQNNWNATAHYDQIMAQVFYRQYKWQNRFEEPFVPIRMMAGSRPRWIGQLCRAAGEIAQTRERFYGIRLEDIEDAMESFGADKLSDLRKEHQHQFSDLDMLVDAFRGGKKHYNRYQLLKRIKDNYVSQVKSIPDVDGHEYYCNVANEADTHIAGDQLGKFLFQMEFIAVETGKNTKATYYHNNPDLFDSIENKKNNIMWTINRSYWKYFKLA